VLINEAKPVLNIWDHNFNVSGGSNTSVWTNFTLNTVQKMYIFNKMMFERVGHNIDAYGFDWYDSMNVTDNKKAIKGILAGLQDMPNAQHHRYFVFPFVIKDDFNVSSPQQMNRDEFMMNKAIYELARESANKISLLVVWVGTKEFSSADTIITAEQYLNATPPASFVLVQQIGATADELQPV